MKDDPISILDTMVTDRELVFHFFAVFSRFEFALKSTSQFLAGDEKEAKANWDQYANSIRGYFDRVSDETFKDALSYLTSRPPRKQIVKNGAMSWRESARAKGDSLEAFVLRLVRTVRNNLFHGGKYPSGPVEEVARNRKLLESCRTILLQCLEASPEIACRYREAA